MPIIKSAKKRLKQNPKRRKLNQQKKQEFRKLCKEIRKLAGSSFDAANLEKAKKLLPQTYKALDKAVKSGVIKKNTASRNKSRLTKLVGKPVSKKQAQAVEK